MRIVLRKLLAWGPGNKTAELKFGVPSHLVFGPTDTGKSYVVQCIRYCLGGNERPEDIGWSSGYTRLVLHISSGENEDVTIFRELTEGGSAAFLGHHEMPPQNEGLESEKEPDELLLDLAHGSNLRVLTKSGKLGNLTTDCLRHISVFDEIQTLERVPLEGKDKILKMRNRSVIALALSGTDDSAVVLVETTDKRNVAKGHVEALEQEREQLASGIPEGLTRPEAAAALARVSNELEKINTFLSQNAEQLESLKREQSAIEQRLSGHHGQVVSLTEALERFRLLDRKYQSDRQRLAAISQAASIVSTLESRQCPLCLTDFSHQARHRPDSQSDWLISASKAEYAKIDRLQNELQLAIADLEQDLQTESRYFAEEQERARRNKRAQASIILPETNAAQSDIVHFANRKAELSMAIRDFDRIEDLQRRIETNASKARKRKQTVDRDLANSANLVCRRVHELLSEWGVPGVEAVSFDESVADIRINERRRVSFGKGKRGIFLTAYVVSLMEHALAADTPHLGFVVVDSPVVTYRDPKHGSDDPEEALDPSVKDRFYSWLASRSDGGQIVVFENEEPDITTRSKLSHTEFVGAGGASGRKGFFPIAADGQ